MARDKVHPLKMESPGSGGTQLDDFPTSLNPQEDYVNARGITFQSGLGSNDEAVGLERDGANLKLWDSAAGIKTLSELAASGSPGISEATHKALRQLIHFIDDGPADGFLSGAYKEMTPVGPFPTSYIWYEDATKAKKIVELTVVRNSAQMPTSEEWKMYDTDGSTVLVTLTDAITYTSNVFESSRTRTWV